MPGRSAVLAPEAVADVEQAYEWYERQQPGLGEQFLDRVDACLQDLRLYPEAHAQVAGSYRRALLRRFPYAVFYERLADTVIVYGVFHCARDPAVWRKRLD